MCLFKNGTPGIGGIARRNGQMLQNSHFYYPIATADKQKEEDKKPRFKKKL